MVFRNFGNFRYILLRIQDVGEGEGLLNRERGGLLERGGLFERGA